MTRKIVEMDKDDSGPFTTTPKWTWRAGAIGDAVFRGREAAAIRAAAADTAGRASTKEEADAIRQMGAKERRVILGKGLDGKRGLARGLNLMLRAAAELAASSEIANKQRRGKITRIDLEVEYGYPYVEVIGRRKQR